MKKILLPIKPEYVNRIISGEKRVEYRKKIVSDVNVILIYVTVPVQRIVGEFRVGGIMSGTPDELWNNTHTIGGINKKDFYTYFQRCDKAHAYIISQLKIYDNPLCLSDLGLKRAPQNYQYID